MTGNAPSARTHAAGAACGQSNALVIWGIKDGEPHGVCASCGADAVSYKLIEGERVFICADSALKEMDEWEAPRPPLN